VLEGGMKPPADCPLCPRLFEFRHANGKAYPDFFNEPVPSFGTLDAKLLIVGLAPGLKGANRTGRPFTGDYAGELLYGSLKRHGLARGEYGARSDDGFELLGVRISNAVRCVPPENKPLPVEIKTCRQFLVAEIAAMTGLKAILSLGQISHDSVASALALKKKDHRFSHGARYNGGRVTLLSNLALELSLLALQHEHRRAHRSDVRRRDGGRERSCGTVALHFPSRSNGDPPEDIAGIFRLGCAFGPESCVQFHAGDRLAIPKDGALLGDEDIRVGVRVR
jgi:uracil-DNA glycosylase family 4